MPGKEASKDEVVFNLANHTIGQIDEEDEHSSGDSDFHKVREKLGKVKVHGSG